MSSLVGECVTDSPLFFHSLLRLIVGADFSDNDEAEVFSLVLPISISSVITREIIESDREAKQSDLPLSLHSRARLLLVARYIGKRHCGHAAVPSEANVITNEW